MFLHAPVTAPADVPPLNGEPLPLEFVNTVFPVRGTLRDGLRTPEHLIWWLRSCRGRLATDLPDDALNGITPTDTHCFILLRDAAHRLVSAYVHEREPDGWDVAQINRASSMGRPWPLLRWEADGTPSSVEVSITPPVLAVQAEIAHALIRVLDGTSGLEPRACPAPGCVFFFDHARSRREWCSTGCGNRARAARHYARHHRTA
ncbi:CGNR zinc finger domain-containing protein [Streptomyces sp. NPDC000410]|uniref:CGNR zinc finger domain-containing protein n=1 Tax=Streptomyces sp. NPDC000410 TaxID=3154254 RepID=UPI00331CABAE